MAIDLRLQSPVRSTGMSRRGRCPQAMHLLGQVLTTILRWREVRRQRRALLELGDHLLKDIGISRDDATREASRPFWDTGVETWCGWR